MDLSTFLAQLFAVAYLSIGVGMLLDKAFYRHMLDEVYKDHLGMYLGGILALVAGFSIVSTHNLWVKDWTVLVTIIGWLALVKGVGLLAFPTKFMHPWKHVMASKRLTTISGIVIVLGLVFGYYGFVA